MSPIFTPRTSISSYRAETCFFKTLASTNPLRGIAPHAFWVHVDDRLGYPGDQRAVQSLSQHEKTEGGDAVAEQAAIDELRKSSFMLITGCQKVRKTLLVCEFSPSVLDFVYTVLVSLRVWGQ